MRLTLRTLLAYLDDTLDPAESREIGLKLAENPPTQELVDRIRKLTRKRSLAAPSSTAKGDVSDPNTVAQYLSNSCALTPEQVMAFEKACLESDSNLAEVAACHQILALVLAEQIRVPPSSRRRMYELVGPPTSLHNRKPGATIPIGGSLESDVTVDDRADAAYLMGLPAYSRADSLASRAGRLALVGLLAGIVVLAVIMAWPKKHESTRETVAWSTTTTPPSVATVIPTPVEPTTVPSGREVAPPPHVAEAKKPDEMPVEPKAEPTKPPMMTINAPSQDRVVFGKWEKKEPTAILVRTTPTTPTWTRVPTDEPNIITTDKLVCLPGYKATIRFDNEVHVDLWGNLPDLFPSTPLLEAALTPTAPPAGYDADLTLHAGRFYLSAKRPAGALVRLRFAGEVWDVKLADDKTEIAIEVSPELVGGVMSTAKVSAGLHVTAGALDVMALTLKPTRLSKGDELYWDSVKKEIRPRTNPDARSKSERSAYWSKFPVYPDTERAKLTLTALDQFSKKLTDPNRVRATFDEALQEKTEPTLQAAITAKVAVMMFSSLGDLNALCDSLTDPNRPFIRESGISAVRAMMASDPAKIEKFREVLIEKPRLTEDQADATIRLLRGFTSTERNDPATLTLLEQNLNSTAIPVRELAFATLLSYIDPKDTNAKILLTFDAAGTPENRSAAYNAWKAKIADLKKKLETPTP
jgi:hypothetical protein